MFAFAEDDNDLSRQVRDCFKAQISKMFYLKCKCAFCQVFVHCEAVICDAQKPQDGVCSKLCSKEEIGIKGRLF